MTLITVGQVWRDPRKKKVTATVVKITGGAITCRVESYIITIEPFYFCQTYTPKS